MSKELPEGLDDEHAAWVEAQPLFFVATAPAAGGHVNVSPKGYDSLRVVAPKRVAYRDLTGSGAETIAHLEDDGRITLMWCGFDRRARIVRVQGTGRALLPRDEGYATLDRLVPQRRGVRAIIEVHADRVSTSCGYSVPLMDLVAERDTLDRWTANKGEDELIAYRSDRNARSIDGLPAYPATPGV